MKILFFGDSITDAGRYRTGTGALGLGCGYVLNIACELLKKYPTYEILNRGVCGNRVVDLLARAKEDVWNNNPDVLSILIGVNDVWHEVFDNKGVDLDLYEKVYRIILDKSLEVNSNLKVMIMEPFVLKGTTTENRFEEFLLVKEYAKVSRKLAQEYGFKFVPLQEKLDQIAKINGTSYITEDGVHPNVGGVKLIAEEWLKAFETL